MPDILKIKGSNNTVYNIKDPTAQNELNTAKGSCADIGERINGYNNTAASTIELIDRLIQGNHH